MTEFGQSENDGPRVGSLNIVLDGEARAFHYPEIADTGAYISRILGGQEYPIFKNADWVPTVVVDVGANVGASAMQFLASYPEAEVHCFEPAPEAHCFLTENLDGIERAHVHAYGLYSEAGTRTLYRGQQRLSQNSLFPGGEATHDGVQVEVRRARQVFLELGLKGCDILKIDTEGCEVPILSDLGGLIREVAVVHLEYHAEDDRLFMDRFLSPFFYLWAAAGYGVHRGANTYLSRALVERFPHIAFPAIEHDVWRRRGAGTAAAKIVAA
jgi:FkbM family methyltransferase